MTIPWSPEWKQERLEELQLEWSNCAECPLCETRQSVVFGSGNPDADVMFIGEAPGAVEDEEGVPFVGPSGELLQSFFDGMGKRREDYYITNLLMCHPPEDRNPNKAEKDACRPRLNRQIYIIDPMIIVIVGSQALKSLGGSSHQSVEADLGEIFDIGIEGAFFNDKKKSGLLRYSACAVYHPAYILRKDTYDERTKMWREGGPAHHTYFGIENAIELVEELKHEYLSAVKRSRR